jgi:hypothetical protein
MPDGQQAGQDNVFDVGKNVTKTTLEIFFNYEYNPAAELFWQSCVNKLTNVPKRETAKNYILKWISLYKKIWMHVNDKNVKMLDNMRDFMFQFFTEGGDEDYQKLLGCVMTTDIIAKESGLFNITINKTSILLDAGDLEYLFTHA